MGIFGPSKKIKHSIQIASYVYEAFVKVVEDENPDEVVEQLMREYITEKTTIKQPTEPTITNPKNGKGWAVQLAREAGFLYNSPTYAKWTDTQKYYMNPAPEKLDQDWMILLNDKDCCKLHIFVVPAGTLDISQFHRRKDTGDLDIHIDRDFIDSPRESAHVDFSKYFKQTIDY